MYAAVYADNHQADVYQARLAKLDGAQLVRLRYYGPRQTGPEGDTQTVFVEIKTHRDKDAGEVSTKVSLVLMMSI